MIGVTATKIVGGNIKAGGSVAASSTKNNYLGEEFVKETSEYIKNQCKNVIKDNINRLIYTGMLSNPEDIQYDYRIFMNGAALPIKFVSGSCGYILDKKGNVYVLIEADGGFGVSTPITITDGFGNFNAAKETREDYQNAIEGFSGGGGAAGIQLTVSTSTSGIVSSEVTGTTSAGATLFSGRYVHYLFNLYDN